MISAILSGGTTSIIIPLVTLVLVFLLKKIPNDLIQKWWGGLCEKIGIVMTLGLSRFKFTAPFWNKVVEPYFIDLLKNFVETGVLRFVKGLTHDTPK